MSFKKRGNCYLILLALVIAISVSIYFHVQQNTYSPKKKKLKPIIKTFPHKISGKWKARLVKINPPPRKKKRYRPTWMHNDNYKDFTAEIEIGKDFKIKKAKWVEFRNSHLSRYIEWNSPESWKFTEKNSIVKRAQPENSRTTRNGKKLTLYYSGNKNREVRQCNFTFTKMPPIPPNKYSDGGFRKGVNDNAIEAEVIFFAPELYKQKIDTRSFNIEVTPFGIKDKIKNRGIGKMLKFKSGNFPELGEFEIQGYPANLLLSIFNCRVEVWYEKNGKKITSCRLSINQGSKVTFRAFSQTKKIKIIFDKNGKGKMFSHDGIMEYELVR